MGLREAPVCNNPRLGLDQAFYGLRRFGDHAVGLVAHGVTNAMAYVLVEQADGDALECFRHGADLGEDLDAVGVLVDHALQTLRLAGSLERHHTPLAPAR